MTLDRNIVTNNTMELGFEKREQDILARIKKHYGQKLGRDISDTEAKEIADNLLHFAKAIYGA